VTECLSKK